MRLRRRGRRINLRPLADLRNLFWLPVALALVYYTCKLVGVVVWALVAAAPQGEGAFAGGETAAHHAAQHAAYRQAAAEQAAQQGWDAGAQQAHQHHSL